MARNFTNVTYTIDACSVKNNLPKGDYKMSIGKNSKKLSRLLSLPEKCHNFMQKLYKHDKQTVNLYLVPTNNETNLWNYVEIGTSCSGLEITKFKNGILLKKSNSYNNMHIYLDFTPSNDQNQTVTLKTTCNKGK